MVAARDWREEGRWCQSGWDHQKCTPSHPDGIQMDLEDAGCALHTCLFSFSISEKAWLLISQNFESIDAILKIHGQGLQENQQSVNLASSQTACQFYCPLKSGSWVFKGLLQQQRFSSLIQHVHSLSLSPPPHFSCRLCCLRGRTGSHSWAGCHPLAPVALLPFQLARKLPKAERFLKGDPFSAVPKSQESFGLF